jgi:hypothetical protein
VADRNLTLADLIGAAGLDWTSPVHCR